MLIGQMAIYFGNHFQRRVAHQLCNGSHIDPPQYGLSAKGVTQQIRTYIGRHKLLSLQPVNAEAYSIDRPWSPPPVKKNIIGLGFSPQILHQPLHTLGHVNHARFASLMSGFMLRQHPAIFFYLIPSQRSCLFWTASGFFQSKQQDFEFLSAISHQTTIFFIRQCTITSLAFRAFHSAERIAIQYPLLVSPGESPLNRTPCVIFGRRAPFMAINPTGHVNRAKFRNKNISECFGKHLTVPSIVSKRFVGQVFVCPCQKSFDYIGNPSRRCLWALMRTAANS